MAIGGGGGELRMYARGSLPYKTDSNGPNEVSIPVARSFSLEEKNPREGRIFATVFGATYFTLSSVAVYAGAIIPKVKIQAAATGYGLMAFGLITIPPVLLFAYHAFNNAPDRTDLSDPSTFTSVVECLRRISLADFTHIQSYYRKNHLFKIENLKERSLIDENLAAELKNIVQRFLNLKRETLVEEHVINDIHPHFRQLMNALIAQLEQNRMNYSAPNCLDNFQCTIGPL